VDESGVIRTQMGTHNRSEVVEVYRSLCAIPPCNSRLGGVAVSVLATGPKCCGFEPGQGNGFLRAIKIRSTPSSRVGSTVGRSHVVRFYVM
jgi:hypothetical protein